MDGSISIDRGTDSGAMTLLNLARDLCATAMKMALWMLLLSCLPLLLPYISIASVIGFAVFFQAVCGALGIALLRAIFSAYCTCASGGHRDTIKICAKVRALVLEDLRVAMARFDALLVLSSATADPAIVFDREDGGSDASRGLDECRSVVDQESGEGNCDTEVRDDECGLEDRSSLLGFAGSSVDDLGGTAWIDDSGTREDGRGELEKGDEDERAGTRPSNDFEEKVCGKFMDDHAGFGRDDCSSSASSVVQRGDGQYRAGTRPSNIFEEQKGGGSPKFMDDHAGFGWDVCSSSMIQRCDGQDRAGTRPSNVFEEQICGGFMNYHAVFGQDGCSSSRGNGQDRAGTRLSNAFEERERGGSEKFIHAVSGRDDRSSSTIQRDDGQDRAGTRPSYVFDVIEEQAGDGFARFMDDHAGFGRDDCVAAMLESLREDESRETLEIREEEDAVSKVETSTSPEEKQRFSSMLDNDDTQSCDGFKQGEVQDIDETELVDSGQEERTDKSSATRQLLGSYNLEEEEELERFLPAGETRINSHRVELPKQDGGASSSSRSRELNFPVSIDESDARKCMKVVEIYLKQADEDYYGFGSEASEAETTDEFSSPGATYDRHGEQLRFLEEAGSFSFSSCSKFQTSLDRGSSSASTTSDSTPLPGRGRDDLLREFDQSGSSGDSGWRRRGYSSSAGRLREVHDFGIDLQEQIRALRSFPRSTFEARMEEFASSASSGGSSSSSSALDEDLSALNRFQQLLSFWRDREKGLAVRQRRKSLFGR